MPSRLPRCLWLITKPCVVSSHMAVWGANGWKPLTLTQTRCWQHPQFYSKWNGGKKPTTWAAFTMKLYVYNNVLLLGHRSAVSQGAGKWNQLWIVRNSLGMDKKKKNLTGRQKTLFINVSSFRSLGFSGYIFYSFVWFSPYYFPYALSCPALLNKKNCKNWGEFGQLLEY